MLDLTGWQVLALVAAAGVAAFSIGPLLVLIATLGAALTLAAQRPRENAIAAALPPNGLRQMSPGGIS